MSLINEQAQFVKDVASLIVKADSLGFDMTAGEMWRPAVMAWVNSLPPHTVLVGTTSDGSHIQYDQVVGGAGIAKSKHMDRLAVDFNIFRKDDHTKLCTRDEIKPLGDYWELLNGKNRWGGNFTTRVDAPHFERNI